MKIQLPLFFLTVLFLSVVVPTVSYAETIDTLDYFVSDHPGQALTGTHPVSQTVVGNRIYNVKFGQAAGRFETYTYDANYIYFFEDHGNQWYGFSPGTWLKRSMQIGETINVPSGTKRTFSALGVTPQACGTPPPATPYPYSITLESHNPAYNAGGDLGVQDVIVVKYDYGSKYEKFFYSKAYGWIRWEWYDAAGTLLQTSNFNMFSTQFAFPQKLCGTEELNAQFVSQTIPAQMTAGYVYDASITFKNTGSAPWTAADLYRLGSEAPRSNKTWGPIRVDLSSDEIIYPGQQKTFSFKIQAPYIAGTYTFQWGMLRENIRWFGTLSTALTVTVNALQNPSSFPEIINTLDYFLTDHPDRRLYGTGTTGVDNHALNQVIFNNAAFQMKWSGAFEKYTWDNNYIYLNEDNSANVTGNTHYSHTNGIFMKRTMGVGERINVGNNTSPYYSSASSCALDSSKTTNPVPFPYNVILEKHIPNYQAGGDLGTQDVIVLRYGWGDLDGNFERFYYSKEWGWIKHERYTNNVLDHESFFNRFSTQQPLSYTSIENLQCTTKPIGTPIIPPLEGDLTGDHTVNTLDWSYMNTHWGTSDQIADINHDGVVNSIDFYYLNKNWGKTAT